MLLQADAALIPLKDKSVHCVVTSPPYWGLRKYTGEQGRGEYPNLGLEPTPELHIQHIVEIFREVKRVLRDDGVVWLNYGDCYSGGGRGKSNSPIQSCNRGHGETGPGYRGIQGGNLMLMPHRVAIALQEDGVTDLNAMRTLARVIADIEGKYDDYNAIPDKVRAVLESLDKEYSEARDGGWIVRNDLIWFKRNPMPESCAGWRFEKSRTKIASQPKEEKPYADGQSRCGDRVYGLGGGVSNALRAEYEYGEDYELRKGSWRHTRAHEYIFMLTKKMQYYSNQEAVREGLKDSSIERMNYGWDGNRKRDYPDGPAISDRGLYNEEDGWRMNKSGRNPRTVLDVPQEMLDAFYYWLGERIGIDLYEAIELFNQEMTNPDDVLDVPTSPYKGAHYATFPPNLIAPLIRASCPRRACPECGRGWAPVVEDNTPRTWKDRRTDKMLEGTTGLQWGTTANVRILDYRPTCECGHDEYVPGIVLDPFIGSGTTGAVARELQRRWVGLDISMEYLDQQAKIRALNLTPSNALDELPLFNL